MKRRILAVVLMVAILFTAFASVSYAGTKRETGLYKVDGKWKYYENGKFTKATGLVKKAEAGTWHYVEKGVYKKVTGLVKCVQPGSSKDKWYYVYKGDLSKKATGMVQCVQPGRSKGKWYYVENGKLKKVTGLVKCIQPKSKAKGKWYYVRNGKQNKSFTGLAQCVQVDSSSYRDLYRVKKGKKYAVTELGDYYVQGWYTKAYYKKGKLMNTTGKVTINGKKYTLEDGFFQFDTKYKKSKGKLETSYFTLSVPFDFEVLSTENFENMDCTWTLGTSVPGFDNDSSAAITVSTKTPKQRKEWNNVYITYYGKTSDGFHVYLDQVAGAEALLLAPLSFKFK